jgi:hypothetical protein
MIAQRKWIVPTVTTLSLTMAVAVWAHGFGGPGGPGGPGPRHGGPGSGLVDRHVSTRGGPASVQPTRPRSIARSRPATLRSRAPVPPVMRIGAHKPARTAARHCADASTRAFRRFTPNSDPATPPWAAVATRARARSRPTAGTPGVPSTGAPAGGMHVSRRPGSGAPGLHPANERGGEGTPNRGYASDPQ